MPESFENLARALFAAGVLGGLLPACGTAPETGRSQVLLVSPQEEVRLGISSFQEVKGSTPISRSPAQIAMLQRVGRRVAAVAPLPGAQWEFVLFDDPKTPNAFCLPGGKVGVYTGILPITRDEDGLASVIGHEVAHAVARHGAERMSEALLIEMGGQVLAAALGTQGTMTRGLALQAYGIGAQVGRALPHSRSQELEADRLGLLYMARAGYDPRKAVEFWRRFQAYTEERGGEPIEFLSTHPLDGRRIAELASHLPEAERQYQKAAKTER
jgi:predicted Zn-dependent protease